MGLSKRLLRTRSRTCRRVVQNASATMAGAVAESLESRLLLATFTVTTTADSGAGSLRQAILNANAAAGADNIHFSIGTGLRTISPASELPTINGPTVVDATTQPGYLGTPVIQLSGGAVASPATGLDLMGDSTIRGFILNGWTSEAVQLGGSGRNVVEHCHIGLSIFGTAAANSDGIDVQSSNNRVGGTATAQRNVISGNTRAGIYIGASYRDNVVQGNYIGVGIPGTSIVPGQQYGIEIHGGSYNVIGGASAGARNIISGNEVGIDIHTDHGLHVDASFNRVLGNYIGTDVSGTVGLGNLRSGVRVRDGAWGNTIGDAGAGAGNIISDNVTGVEIVKDVPFAPGVAFPHTNRLYNNYIGLSATGLDLGNFREGVIIGSSDNWLGYDLAAGYGNVISGNGGTGVIINGEGNRLLGNLIGLNPAGTAAVPNEQDGVSIGTAHNEIGGFHEHARNVISGNRYSGVQFYGEFANSNRVEGNIIGLDRMGNSAIPNAAGVYVNGGNGNSIGGTTPAHRNVISGNTLAGVYIAGASNHVRGNYIGTDITGALARGNRWGVQIFGMASSPRSIIGGATAAERNVISGNAEWGITVELADGQWIGNNYIGTDYTGNAALGNGAGGVWIDDSNDTIIGSDGAVFAPNVISANRGPGVDIVQDLERPSEPTRGNLVFGNYIGLGADGMQSLSNASSGVRVSGAQGTRIGGAGMIQRNVISRNDGYGILVEGALATDTVVLGNYIGLSADGTLNRGNLRGGIGINGASGVRIGDTLAAANVISHNDIHGIEILSATPLTGVEIRGNRIGTSPDGTINKGNGAAGIWVEVADGSQISIGGTAAGQGNTIRDHRYDGIVVARGTGVTIRGNSIHLNGELGIDLAGDEVTPNDPSDADAGQNLRQNFPEILSAARAGGGVMISGRLETAPGANYGLDFYASPTADPSGYGEGEVYLGNTMITVPASGSAPFDVTLPALVPIGYVVTATATDAAGNTSEFSPTHGVALDLIPPRVIDARPRFDRLPHGFRAAFSEDVSESLKLDDVVVVNLDTKKKVELVKLDYDVKTDAATLEFAGMLPDGNYRATFLASGITDIWGNRLDGDGDGKPGDDYNFDFFFLTADADGDRSVGFGDLVIVAQNYNSSGKTFTEGNLNYDAGGKVGFEDLVLLAQGYGRKLPEPQAASVAAAQPAAAKSVAQMPTSSAKRPAAKKLFGTRQVTG